MKGRLIAITYGDSSYEPQRKWNALTAKNVGKADDVWEYSPDDIQDFINENAKIFSIKRGAGLWLWKPYIILKSLQRANDGDWVFYADSAIEYVSDIHALVDCAIQNHTDRLFFETRQIARKFTKRETFIAMNCVDKDHFQVLGGFLLFQKNNSTIAFVSEWLDYCKEEKLLSSERFDLSIEEDADFIAHREDQSILDILVSKYKFQTFRDPSDYGYFSIKGDYCKEYVNKFSNSNYPTILILYRRDDKEKYKRRYKCRQFLFHLFGGGCLYSFFRSILEFDYYGRIWIPIKKVLLKIRNSFS